jgi:deoxyribonuclease-4
MILESTGDSGARVGFCFDTCHAHAGGYDLSTPAAAAAAFAEWDRTCGLDHIRVLHLNDSKTPMGSRRDRHEHIGQGSIGLKGFGAVLRIPQFRDRPKILETPKDEAEGETPHDTLNLRRLRKLFPASPKPATTSKPARR